MDAHGRDEGDAQDHATPSTIYEIRIGGHLGPEWTSWFDGMTVALEANGDPLLRSPLVDQAALHAVLRRVRDLGLTLRSVVLIPRTDTLTRSDG